MKRSISPLFLALSCVALLCCVFVLQRAFSEWGAEGGLSGGADVDSLHAQSMYSQKVSISTRQHLSRNPASKRINVGERLAALYEKYPELKPQEVGSEKDFRGLFERLFPTEDEVQYEKDMGSLLEMLHHKADWDEEAMLVFLRDNQWRLDSLKRELNEAYDYREVDLTQKRKAYEFLSLYVSLEFVTGGGESADESREVLESLMRSTSKADLLGFTFAKFGQYRTNHYIFLNSAERINEAKGALLESPEITFEQLLKEEMESVLSMVYSAADEGEDGKFYLEKEEGEQPIPVGVFEEVFVKVLKNRLDYYQALEVSGEFKSEEQIEAEFKEFIQDSSFFENESLAAYIADNSYGSIYVALLRSNYLAAIQSEAISIALHQVRNTDDYSLVLPSHYKTGKAATWDKERNVLITGLEGDDAEIAIPALKTE